MLNNGQEIKGGRGGRIGTKNFMGHIAAPKSPVTPGTSQQFNDSGKDQIGIETTDRGLPGRNENVPMRPPLTSGQPTTKDFIDKFHSL